MALSEVTTRLGCGRDIDEVWDHLERPPDLHEQSCPYCTAARADLRGLASATRAMREDDATAPGRQPGSDLLGRVLSVARSEVRRGRRIPFDQPGASTEGGEELVGGSSVSEQAVSTVVRRLGDRTGRLQIRRCTVSVVDPVAPPEPASRATRVEILLTASAAADLAIPAACESLRGAVIDGVRRETGLEVERVAVVVEDLHDA